MDHYAPDTNATFVILADYGDVYFYAEPGYILFPNDFYQPIANVALSLLDRHQRCRLWNPRHRGDHGYFPEHACERGFMILADENFSTSLDSAALVDFAPSVLALLGQERPDSMKGRSVSIVANVSMTCETGIREKR